MLVPLETDTNPPVAPVPAPPVRVALPPVPLLACVPAPATTVAAPPATDAAEVAPAVSVASPPEPVAPEPTVTAISPPFPPVAAPEDTVTVPVVPADDVPEEKMTFPLVPELPALADSTVTSPLSVAVPAPLRRESAPPACDEALVAPAVNDIAPPAPVLPVPPATTIAPP